jgi:hypothetical protein
VRFGGGSISAVEMEQIEEWLKSVKELRTTPRQAEQGEVMKPGAG